MRVAVVGGGSIGLAIAWRAAQGGAEVVVHDPEPGSGASRVAAGMIAPVTESHYGEAALTPFMAASADAWPGFARELETASGLPVGLRDVPTVVVGIEDGDRAEVERQTELYRRTARGVETLHGRAVRRAEPLLSHRVRSGVVALEDRAVDPRAVHAALLIAAERAGVRFAPEAVDDRDAVDALDADQVVIAAGCGSARFGLPVRPVRGVVLRLRAATEQAVPRTTVRGYVKGHSVYIVTRENGEVVIGATSDERGFDRTTGTAGAAHDLLRWSIELVPEIAEYHLDEVSVGFRPGTPDNLPLIGRLDPRTIAATGHYRNGIALIPATASAVTALLRGEDAPGTTAFDPARFAAPGFEGRVEPRETPFSGPPDTRVPGGSDSSRADAHEEES
ncbi:glycine oxidase [Glycomyces sambucus]|uniref:glycine oxidase n=1 Tax=Glycomyces sambucus TaxID=380244 RepID=A0A1G9KMQ6_9ACTN|nr:glycine oxidase ThiO [Glycomyces sambucus]SDL50982.1 glycine oxidase [Glycomyces sambucus]